MRALYVEDNALDADLTRRALARATPPIELDIATTVAAGIANIETQPDRYSWVLFDLNLPDADGLQVLHYVREKQLPIAAVAVTGSGDEHSVIRALKLGADDYIIKQDNYLETLGATLIKIQRHAELSFHNRPINVLYAEDDASDALFTLRHMASKAPHIHIDTVDSDHLVLEKLRTTNEYDVLLLDYGLGNTDAVELIDCICNQLNSDIPIVIVTGKGSESVAAQALRSGVVDYIIKDDTYLERLPSTLEFAYARNQLKREKARTTFLAMYEEFLHESREQAEAASINKSRFLANMSHEIRTPLHAISGFNFMLQRTELTPQQREYTQKTSEAIAHLLQVIDNVLDFSKIEAGKLDLAAERFNLDQLLAQVAAIIEPKAKEKNLRFNIDIAAATPKALIGDPLRLKQILINIANNAVKFTERGSVSVAIASSPLPNASIDLTCSISDTGIGLTEQQCETIFDAFDQGGHVGDESQSGTGLGLAICKQLVELLGGTISVNSTPGSGSTFTFSVPIKRDETATAQSSENSATEKLAGRVLLVEDNTINQEVGMAILNHLGLEVDIADDGRRALDILMRAPDAAYAVILMDLQMPEMDGISATKEIRNIPRYATTPIIAMTADALGRDRLRCFAAGMNDYISKPITIATLRRTLEKWLPRTVV
ncbi:MAG: response regulator [Spongiibacteraceae bacterium]